MKKLRLLPFVFASALVLMPTAALPLSSGCGDCDYDPDSGQTSCVGGGTNWARCTAGEYCEPDASGHWHCFPACFGQRCLWT